jgi:hypothetical protein
MIIIDNSINTLQSSFMIITMFRVQATMATIGAYDHSTFIVQVSPRNNIGTFK